MTSGRRTRGSSASWSSAPRWEAPAQPTPSRRGKGACMSNGGAVRLGLAFIALVGLLVFLVREPPPPPGSAFTIVTSAGAIMPPPGPGFEAVETGDTHAL